MKHLALAVLLTGTMLAGKAAAQDHSHHAPAAAQPPQPPAAAQGHDHHEHPAPQPPPSTATAPEIASPTAADRYFDPREMAQARALLRYENGGMRAHAVQLERLEVQAGDGADIYVWEGEAWFGGGTDRVVFKSSGSGEFGGRFELGEIQAVYSRAIDPWFDVQAGVRQDFGRDRPTTYLALGVEGLAPYWFEVEGALFLSHRGDLFGKLEASQDFRLSQDWLLSPRAEVELAFQDSHEEDAGVAELALGLRLHYAPTPRFAPYIGVEWSREYAGGHAGEDAERTAVVVGLRALF